MKRTDPQVKMRLPPELKVQIEEAARLSGKPVSHEIVERLERSFIADARMEQDHEARLRDLEASVRVLMAAQADASGEIKKLKARG